MLGWNSIRLLVRIKETRLIPGLMGMGQVEQNLHYGLEEIRGTAICLTFFSNFDHRTFLRLLATQQENGGRYLLWQTDKEQNRISCGEEEELWGREQA